MLKLGKLRLKKLLLVGIIFVFIVFYIFSTKFSEAAVHNGLTSWFEGQVLGISYEERFCKHVSTWNSSSAYPPVKIVAKQLNIKDGDSVFINGLHCGEWLVALKGTYPNIKLYGVDRDPDSIAYVSKLVNGTYKVSQPFELDKSGIDIQFDHAIIDGVLSIYSPDFQCQTITQMIPMLKAGGSLYIGKNFEQCENKEVEKHLRKYLHVQVLQKCYWSQMCLSKRHDIVEILYSTERLMLSESPDQKEDRTYNRKEKMLNEISACATSVFIYKHIVLHRKESKGSLLPNSKYVGHMHNHACTRSESVNASNINKLNFDQAEIRKAVMDMKIKGLDMH